MLISKATLLREAVPAGARVGRREFCIALEHGQQLRRPTHVTRAMLLRGGAFTEPADAGAPPDERSFCVVCFAPLDDKEGNAVHHCVGCNECKDAWACLRCAGFATVDAASGGNWCCASCGQMTDECAECAEPPPAWRPLTGREIEGLMSGAWFPLDWEEAPAIKALLEHEAVNSTSAAELHSYKLGLLSISALALAVRADAFPPGTHAADLECFHGDPVHHALITADGPLQLWWRPWREVLDVKCDLFRFRRSASFHQRAEQLRRALGGTQQEHAEGSRAAEMARRQEQPSQRGSVFLDDDYPYDVEAAWRAGEDPVPVAHLGLASVRASVPRPPHVGANAESLDASSEQGRVLACALRGPCHQ
jgi:hypothetical protein